MYTTDIRKLRGKIAEKQTTLEAVAAAAEINRSTLFRRLKSDQLRISDIHRICKYLKLERDEIIDIFFGGESA